MSGIEIACQTLFRIPKIQARAHKFVSGFEIRHKFVTTVSSNWFIPLPKKRQLTSPVLDVQALVDVAGDQMANLVAADKTGYWQEQIEKKIVK